MGQFSFCAHFVLIQRVKMKYAVASLLLLAVAARAQFPYYGNGFYNPVGFYGTPYNYGYGFTGLPATTATAYSAPAYTAYSAPAYTTYSAPVAAPVVAAPVATPVAAPVVAASPYYGYGSSASQYRSQDEFGQATYGYAHPRQAAANYQDAFGNQVGSYAYINPEGKEVRVSYVADANGFRVLSNDLPEGPVADLVAPTPVQDTPEVAAAKAEHAVAHAQALALAESSGDRKKRQVFGFGLPSLGFARFAAVHAPVAAVAPVVSVPSVPVREATLTKTVLNPNHAVAYRVD